VDVTLNDAIARVLAVILPQVTEANLNGPWLTDPYTSKIRRALRELPVNALDHYPIHFVMHFIHAAEIVGYCHPNLDHQLVWKDFYEAACRRMHVNPETIGELNARLNADEEAFSAAQNVDVPLRHPTDLREVLGSTSVKSVKSFE